MLRCKYSYIEGKWYSLASAFRGVRSYYITGFILSGTKKHLCVRIREIKILKAMPFEAETMNKDRLGMEMVRFDKFAREPGLI